jgi:N-acetyl-alpha-D-muramate 1-phosphate uridylyltransferase
MVFAAGLGTRMRPVTDRLPKPLVKVGGKALMDHMLDRFAEAGVARAVVNVHYLGDMVEAHLRGRSHPQVLISDERAKLLDQGGGIKRALPLLGPGPFLVCNTDAFWIDETAPVLAGLAAAWDSDKMDMLLLVAERATSVGVDWPGDFDMDAQGRLTKRAEGAVSRFVYSGVAILKPEPFATEAADMFRLAPFFFDAAKRGRLYGHALAGAWLHVGTPQAIGEAEAALARAVA